MGATISNAILIYSCEAFANKPPFSQAPGGSHHNNRWLGIMKVWFWPKVLKIKFYIIVNDKIRTIQLSGITVERKYLSLNGIQSHFQDQSVHMSRNGLQPEYGWP